VSHPACSACCGDRRLTLVRSQDAASQQIRATSPEPRPRSPPPPPPPRAGEFPPPPPPPRAGESSPPPPRPSSPPLRSLLTLNTSGGSPTARRSSFGARAPPSAAQQTAAKEAEAAAAASGASPRQQRRASLGAAVAQLPEQAQKRFERRLSVKLLKPPDKQAALREQQVRPEPEP
jgi:hypothetical protein